ncbi:MAG TPA: hypothetical protein VEW93_11030 [Acidimicrobiales bacterium]|nr:hypothetical protein [Acidimicrobiales bacterium]
MKIADALIAPAVEKAGLTLMPTVRSGTENIQAAIINDLRDADLVLADLSALNPNVFLELGIRSALDKPVCLVWDGLDILPFDTATLNAHKYDPRPVYELNQEIDRLSDFIIATLEKSDGRNELWRFFGTASDALPAAELDPSDASLHSKVDRLAEIVERYAEISSPSVDAGLIASLVRELRIELEESGPHGVHGSLVRRRFRRELGASYEVFLQGLPLHKALIEQGLPVRADGSGNFILVHHLSTGDGDE